MADTSRCHLRATPRENPHFDPGGLVDRGPPRAL